MFCVSLQTEKELAPQFLQQGVSNASWIVKFDAINGVNVGNKCYDDGALRYLSTGYQLNI